MSIFSKRSLTLIELLLAMVLMAVVVLAGYNLYGLSRVQLIDSMRWTDVQNEVSYVLEHMAGNIAKGIGDANNRAVNLDEISSDTAVGIYIDANEDGLRNDHWIAYRSRINTGASDQRYEFWYCAHCGGAPPCTNCATNWEVLSRKITDFQRRWHDNYVFVQMQGRWKPTEVSGRENPEVMMQNNIKMQSVCLR